MVMMVMMCDQTMMHYGQDNECDIDDDDDEYAKNYN